VGQLVIAPLERYKYDAGQGLVLDLGPDRVYWRMADGVLRESIARTNAGSVLLASHLRYLSSKWPIRFELAEVLTRPGSTD
jgi:hypothetical protein